MEGFHILDCDCRHDHGETTSRGPSACSAPFWHKLAPLQRLADQMHQRAAALSGHLAPSEEPPPSASLTVARQAPARPWPRAGLKTRAESTKPAKAGWCSPGSVLSQPRRELEGLRFSLASLPVILAITQACAARIRSFIGAGASQASAEFPAAACLPTAWATRDPSPRTPARSRTG